MVSAPRMLGCGCSGNSLSDPATSRALRSMVTSCHLSPTPGSSEGWCATVSAPNVPPTRDAPT